MYRRGGREIKHTESKKLAGKCYRPSGKEDNCVISQGTVSEEENMNSAGA